MEKLIEFLSQSASTKGLVYRGHKSKNWKLIPTIYRFPGDMLIDPGSHRERFKKYLIGKIENLGAYSDMEIWAIGQHYGLHTPLLDWSVSPAVAMYFSFLNYPDQADDYSPTIHILNAERLNEVFCSVIYAEMERLFPNLSESFAPDWRIPGWMGKHLIELYAEKKIALSPREVAFAKILPKIERQYPRMYSPSSYFSGRIVGQRGLFSYSTNPIDLPDVLQQIGLQDLLTTVNINPELKFPALEFLDGMNVNPMTIFPDINGAAQYANFKLKPFISGSKPPTETRYWL